MDKNILKAEIFNQLEMEDLLKKEESVRMTLLMNPNDIDMLSELAILLYHKGDYSSAIKIYKKVVDYKEDKAESFAFLGHLYYENEEYLKAIRYFEKALEIDKNYIEKKDIYFYLGQSYFRTENYSEAVNDYKNSLNLEKNDEKKAEIYYNIGMAYNKLGDNEQAVNYLTYVRQNYKNSPWSVKSSLYLLQQMQQYPQN